MLRQCVYGIICAAFVFGMTGCNKWTKDYADSEKPDDSPEYTVEYNPNISPAEGGSRKPTN